MKKGEIEMSTIVAIIALLAGLLIIGSIVWVAVGGITTEVPEKIRMLGFKRVQVKQYTFQGNTSFCMRNIQHGTACQ